MRTYREFTLNEANIFEGTALDFDVKKVSEGNKKLVSFLTKKDGLDKFRNSLNQEGQEILDDIVYTLSNANEKQMDKITSKIGNLEKYFTDLLDQLALSFSSNSKLKNELESEIKESMLQEGKGKAIFLALTAGSSVILMLISKIITSISGFTLIVSLIGKYLVPLLKSAIKSPDTVNLIHSIYNLSDAAIIPSLIGLIGGAIISAILAVIANGAAAKLKAL